MATIPSCTDPARVPRPPMTNAVRPRVAAAACVVGSLASRGGAQILGPGRRGRPLVRPIRRAAFRPRSRARSPQWQPPRSECPPGGAPRSSPHVPVGRPGSCSTSERPCSHRRHMPSRRCRPHSHHCWQTEADRRPSPGPSAGRDAGCDRACGCRHRPRRGRRSGRERRPERRAGLPGASLRRAAPRFDDWIRLVEVSRAVSPPASTTLSPSAAAPASSTAAGSRPAARSVSRMPLGRRPAPDVAAACPPRANAGVVGDGAVPYASATER